MLLLSMVRQPLKPNPRTTASHMPSTWKSLLRRRLLSMPKLFKSASPTKAPSRTRSGPMPRQLPRKRKRTLLLDLVARPSVSVSASRSSSSKSTSASSRHPSVDEAVSAVAEAVAMDHPEAIVATVATVATEVTSAEDVATEADVVVVVVTSTEVLPVAAPETTTPALPQHRG
jgi:hypothetical protein